ncbi:MAG: hypothetical protein NTZ21_10835 [Actinobacteria bacterium]|nr:hypothetical protein [Actinomycetota bacterium]
MAEQRAHDGRIDPRPPDRLEIAAVVGLGICLAVWRVVVLSRHGDPVGVDIGNLLRVAESWWGAVDVDDVVYPPIVPLFAWCVRALIGTAWTAHLLQGVASVAPAVGVWTVCRRHTGPVAAAAAALGVTAAVGTSAAAAWGGVPQLLGLGLLPSVVVAAERWTRRPTRRAALVWGAWLTATMLISTIVTGAAVVASAATGLTVVLVDTDRSVGARIVAIVRTGVWAVLPILLTAPWYVPILRAQSLPEGRSTAVRGTDALLVVLGPPAWLWWALLAAAVIVTARVLRSDRPGAAVATGLLLAAFVGLAIGEVRAAYVVPTAMAIALAPLASAFAGDVRAGDRPGAAVAAGRRDRRAAAVAGVAAGVVVVCMAAVTPARFDDEVARYGRYTPDGTLLAASWLHDHVVEGDRVVAAPVDGVPTGWWVEAEGVDAWVAARAEWLFFPEERRTAAVAELLLSAGAWPDDTSLDALTGCSVDWVVLPDAWGGVDDAALVRAVATGRIAVAYDDGTTTILRVAATAEGDLTTPSVGCPIS